MKVLQSGWKLTAQDGIAATSLEQSGVLAGITTQVLDTPTETLVPELLALVTLPDADTEIVALVVGELELATLDELEEQVTTPVELELAQEHTAFAALNTNGTSVVAQFLRTQGVTSVVNRA